MVPEQIARFVAFVAFARRSIAFLFVASPAALPVVGIAVVGIVELVVAVEIGGLVVAVVVGIVVAVVVGIAVVAPVVGIAVVAVELVVAPVVA